MSTTFTPRALPAPKFGNLVGHTLQKDSEVDADVDEDKENVSLENQLQVLEIGDEEEGGVRVKTGSPEKKVGTGRKVRKLTPKMNVGSGIDIGMESEGEEGGFGIGLM